MGSGAESNSITMTYYIRVLIDFTYPSALRHILPVPAHPARENGRILTDADLPRAERALTDGASRAPARAMLRAVGLTDDDFKRPLIGIANTWIEIGP